MRADSLARQLEQMMQSERALLLGGHLDRLEPLIARKSALMGEIENVSLSAERLEALVAQARGNARLHEAAMRGLASVRDRITALTAGSPGGIYRADGGRDDTAPARATLRRRA